MLLPVSKSQADKIFLQKNHDEKIICFNLIFVYNIAFPECQQPDDRFGF